MVPSATVGTMAAYGVISDLHLGLGSGADLLRRARFREPLLAALGQDRPPRPARRRARAPRPAAWGGAGGRRAAVAALGDAMAGRELVIVPGNHDHHLIEAWLERRTLAGEPALGLEQLGEPEGTAFEALAAHAAAATVRFAYPGIWLRDDVYAIHGHYLDRHLTVPTIERLGVALVERVLGLPPPGPDPLAPPDEEPDRIDEYERVQTPVYAFLFNLAQATVGERRAGANPSARIWQMLGGGETRSAKLRSWVLGAVAVPGAVGVANRLGLGPVRSDLSAGAIARRVRGHGRGGRAARNRRRARDLRPHTAAAPRMGRRQPRSGTPAAGSTRRAARRDRGGEPVLAGNARDRRGQRPAAASSPARRPQPGGPRR